MLVTTQPTDPWRIQDATADDLTRLARLMAEAPLLRRYATSYAQALEALRQALTSGDLLLKLCSEGDTDTARGLAWVIFTRAFDHAAYLRLLLVESSAQRGGAGARLLMEVEARAQARARHLYLMVTRDNVGARQFYERFAFREVGELPAHVRPDLDEVLYYKKLSTEY